MVCNYVSYREVIKRAWRGLASKVSRPFFNWSNVGADLICLDILKVIFLNY